MTALAFVVIAMSCGCQTRPPGDADREQSRSASPGERSTPGSSSMPGTTSNAAPRATSKPPRRPPTRPPVVDRPSEGLPAALSPSSIGSFEAAPWLDGTERAAVLEVGGKPFIAAAGTGFLRVFSPTGTLVAEVTGTGAAHALERIGSSGDNPVLVLGRGIGRHARTAPTSVVLYTFDGRSLGPPEVVPMPQSTRAQVIGIVADPERPDEMWIGAFASKYYASLLHVERTASGGFEVDARDSIRVPLGIALGDPDGDGEPDLFVARPYGDDKEQPGDVFEWLGGADKRAPLSTTRGARAVAVHGRDVFFADGWHKDYGRRANALVTRARRGDSGWSSTVLLHVAGRHGYSSIRIGQIDSDPRPDIVAAGNGPAVVAMNAEPASNVVPTLGTVDAMDIAVGDITGDARDDVIILGERPGVWTYK